LSVFSFQSEVLICTRVVDPELFCPWLFACWFPVEEQHVRLYTLGVKDAGGQTEQRVNVPLFQQLPANGLASAAFEQDVVGDDDGGPAMLLEDGEYVLEEI
jgi:hypothetical protein